MADCKYTKGCLFFEDKLKRMPTTAEVLKREFCRNDAHPKCARYIVFDVLGEEYLPDDLYPDDTEYAERLTRDPRKRSRT